MAITDINGRIHQYRGGKPEVIHLKVTTSVLAELFNVPCETIRRWIRQQRLNPSSLVDIVDKLNNPYLLDKRKKVG